jgi:tetratricopeptide (TPR) repeat protein
MKSAIHKKWLQLFLLILLFNGNSFSQLSERDKLRLNINKAKNDTTRINLLIKFGLDYAENDSVAIICLREAYDLSLKKKYRYGMAFGQYYEVLDMARNGRYDEAIHKCKQCIEAIDSMHLIVGAPLVNIRFLYNSAGRQEEKFQYYSQKAVYYKRHGPSENLANCYHGIAGYYWYLGDYDKAIENYMHARDIVKSIDPGSYAGETQFIGSMYLDWGNLDKAEEFLKSGREELSRLNISTNSFYYYHKMGEIYLKRRKYQQALSYYFEADKYCSNLLEKATNLLNCARVYLELDSNDSAWFYLDSADMIRQKEKLGIVTSQGALEIDYTFYKYYVANGNEKLALRHLKAALMETQSAKYLPFILKYSSELHTYFLSQGDSLIALQYLIQYHTLQDSLNAMSTRARIASYEIEQQQQQKENEIEHLKVQKTTQRNYYLFAGILLIMIVFGIISRIIYKRKRDKEQLTTDFKKQLAEAETKALRAQMNPHFIFNSLNSINSFVMDQKHEIASDYLIKFSKLIRLILDNSRSETISLEKELETLKLYVILEAARFDNRFKCVYSIAEDVDIHSIKIPPMLLQPFVENAIWHGLMQKEGEGTITVEIAMSNEQLAVNNEQLLKITITDDGIGREKAAELKSKSATHKSHGLKVTSQRIEMMNKLNSSGAKVNIIDLKDGQGNAMGTRVELIIPV